jgi:WD40 repeat protein
MNERQNPYVGPRAFETGETLYGRERELRQLESLLIAERIVLLHSPSGAGKTSLIQAGLIPDLLKQDFNILPVIRVNLDLPSDLSSLETANRYMFSTLVALEEGLRPDQRLPLDQLLTLSLDDYLNHRPREAEAPESDLLIFDQFEEILTTASADREGKLAFFAVLGAALRNRDRWALFSMRDDYLGALEPFMRPIPGQLEHHYRLDLLGPEAALLAIQKPARASGVEFTGPAASKLVDDLRAIQAQQPDGTFERTLGQYVEPVQLQVVCYRLWEAMPEVATQIAPEDIQNVGSVDEALGEYYAASLAQIAETEKVDERLLRQWFSEQLITPEGIRGQALSGREQSAGVSAAVLRQLENAHLIRGETRAGKLWYELAHDRLVEPVRQANTAWFDANLSLLQKQATLWVEQGRGDGLLLRGKELAEAEKDASQLTGAEKEFLKACQALRQHEQREQHRNAFMTALAIIATLALIVAVTFYFKAQASAASAQAASAKAVNNANTAATARAIAVIEKQNAIEKARLARAGELDAQSAELHDKQPIVSYLLGLEAFHIVNNVHTHATLLNNLNSRPQLDQYLTGHKDRVWGVAFSPDGKMLASSSEDQTIILWDVTTRQPIGQPLTGHNDFVWSISFSPDGKTLASVSDKTIIIWDVTTHQPIGQPLTGHNSLVWSVAFSPDGKTLASTDDNSIILWDVTTQQPIGQPLTGHNDSVWSLAFSPDGKTLASASGDKTIILWDVTTQQPIGQPLTGHNGPVMSVAFSPDGKMLASGGKDKTIILWDVTTHQPIGQPLTGNNDWVWSIAFSPDGKTLASAGGDKTVILWDIAARQSISQPLTGHNDWVWSVAFSTDGKKLASGSYDGTIILWDVTTHQLIGQPLTGHNGPVVSVAFSPDGKMLASVSDRTIILWDVTTRLPIGQPLAMHTDSVLSMTFSPNGKILAFGNKDRTIILWDVTTHQPIGQPLIGHHDSVPSVAFSPDGKLLASASYDKTIILWDVTTRQPIGQPLTGHIDGVGSVAFSPDGKTLASASYDKTIILWNVTTHQPIGQPLTGHNDPVWSVAFSPDGKTLASASEDKTIILWDITTHQPIGQPLTGHNGPVMSVAFSPDGKTLASGDKDKTIILWDMDVQSWVKKTCHLIGRNFTLAEWAQYFPDESYRTTCPQWPLEPEPTLTTTP